MYNLYAKGILLEDGTDSNNLDLLLNNDFMFSRKYDMERCDWIIKNDPIDWSLVPFGDPEWTFVLNRMDFCYDLCIEFIKTGEIKYLYKSKDLIFDWISKNTEECYHKWTRTLDSGIRLINWVECFKKFEQFEIITKAEKEVFLESIKWQIVYVDAEFQNFQNYSNWGMMQSIGILNASTLVPNSLETKYLQFLKQHLRLEFLDDGMQWEQSAIYILEVLVRLLQLNNPRSKTREYYEVLEKSAYALCALTNVNGKTILIGDGDEVDTIGYLQRVAYILKSEELIQFVSGYQLREEVYFQFGEEVLSYFANNNKQSKSTTRYLLEGAEFFSIKAPNSYFSFQNGNVGGGHGHFDNLHINYSTNGQKILSDRGRYTYVEGSEERRSLKSRAAHNVITTASYNLSYRNAWNNDGLHFYSGVCHKLKGNIDYCYGMAQIDGDKVTLRSTLLFPNGTLFVADYFNGEYEVNYHLDYTAKINKDLLINDSLQLRAHNDESVSITDSFIADVYNRKKGSKQLSITAKDVTTITSFSPKEVAITEITDFTHMYYDRIADYEKNLRLFKMVDDEQSYIIGIKLVDAGNVDNVVKYQGQYLQGSIFVHDLNLDKTYVFKY